jgi:CheY-like chemotaxis protein
LALTTILAIGVDSALLETQRPLWESAGYSVTSAESIREVIVQFRDGDFDLILLGDSIPIEDRKRLTFLIRISGSRIPVVCMTRSSRSHDGFADATIRDRGDILQAIEKLLRAQSKNGCGNAGREVDERPNLYLLQGVRTLQMLWPRRTTTRLSGGVR